MAGSEQKPPASLDDELLVSQQQWQQSTPNFTLTELYAVGRHFTIKRQGILGLFHSKEFDDIKESDMPIMLTQVMAFCQELHPNLTTTAAVTHRLRWYVKKVTRDWRPAKPLVSIPGFEGKVYPEWNVRIDGRLDRTLSSALKVPLFGLPQQAQQCSIQSAFAIATSSMALLRVGDQRYAQDWVLKLSPLAQIVYAIQARNFHGLKDHREDLNKLLGHQIAHLPRYVNGYRNIQDVFNTMFHGIASFSFYTSELPFCVNCDKPILEEKLLRKRTVERSLVSVGSAMSSNHTALQSFFGITRFRIDSTSAFINLEDGPNQESEGDDDEMSRKKQKMNQKAPNLSICPRCKNSSEGYRRHIVLDRLPYFLTLNYDRGGFPTLDETDVRPASNLPRDWLANLTVDCAMDLEGNINPIEYTLTGAIISHGGHHYTTVWLSRDSDQTWLHYDGMSTGGECTTIEEDALADLLDNPAESVAAMLCYKQIIVPEA